MSVYTILYLRARTTTVRGDFVINKCKYIMYIVSYEVSRRCLSELNCFSVVTNNVNVNLYQFVQYIACSVVCCQYCFCLCCFYSSICVFSSKNSVFHRSRVIRKIQYHPRPPPTPSVFFLLNFSCMRFITCFGFEVIACITNFVKLEVSQEQHDKKKKQRP